MRRKNIRISMLLLGGVLLASCGPGKEHSETIIEIQENAFEADATVWVERGDIAVTTDLEAWIGPKIEQLRFAEDGVFGGYQVQLGDEVHKGEVLAVPLTENLDEQIAAKEKEIEDLTVDYEYRKAALENEKDIAALELERVYEKLDNAEYGTEGYTALCLQAGQYDEQCKRLELQLKQLTETYELELPHCRSERNALQKKKTGNRIVAPFDGIVVATGETAYGDRIDTDQYYVALADPSVIYARCAAMNVGTVQSMEKITLWKDGKTYPVEFVLKDSKFYREMRGRSEDNYMEFVVEGAEDLQFGDYGLIRMTSKQKENVLLLPETAVEGRGDNTYVYKDVDGNKVMVPVQTGYRNGLMVEITEGLEEGDVVYVRN